MQPYANDGPFRLWPSFLEADLRNSELGGNSPLTAESRFGRDSNERIHDVWQLSSGKPLFG
jgi:hypothetical protein